MMFAPCGDRALARIRLVMAPYSSIRWTDAVNYIVVFGLIGPMYRLTENACITCCYYICIILIGLAGGLRFSGQFCVIP